ncbi:MAG: hypothetical protein U9R38_05070 [Candidatus Margulisiibacteriota bacterium]|nr:hypothetical protein [Candidatus Margulisiibacteriota bacterium]
MPGQELGTKGILRKPLRFQWLNRSKQPHPLIARQRVDETRKGLPIDPTDTNFPADRLQEMVAKSQIETRSFDPGFPEAALAAFLHGLKISIEGMTFDFVIKEKSMSLYLGVRVLKDKALSPLEPWQVPWSQRDRFQGLNAQIKFLPHRATDLRKNYFGTETHEGLGWIEFDVPAAGNLFNLHIMNIQEDIYFVEEGRRQLPLSPAHRRKWHLLREWKHLAVAALEDLAPRLGLQSLIAPRNQKYPHLYDGIFSKRLNYDGSGIYLLQPPISKRVGYWTTHFSKQG